MSEVHLVKRVYITYNISPKYTRNHSKYLDKMNRRTSALVDLVSPNLAPVGEGDENVKAAWIFLVPNVLTSSFSTEIMGGIDERGRLRGSRM